MQIEKECNAYLNSNEVIRIIQSRNETFTNRILHCIYKHKALICANIVLVHKIIEYELLTMCKENAFQDAQVAFLKNVEDNKFSADYDTCIPYIKGIFRKKYWREFQRELKRKMNSNNLAALPDENEDTEEQDETLNKVKATVLTLSDEDKKMYNLRYEEGLKPNEIAQLLPLKPQTVREKLCKLHRRFNDNWNH